MPAQAKVGAVQIEHRCHRQMSDALNPQAQMRPRYNGARALLRQYTWANIEYNIKTYYKHVVS